MFKSSILAAIGAIIALSAFTTAASAQDTGGFGTQPGTQAVQAVQDQNDRSNAENARQQREQRNRNRPPPPPTPAENAAAAQAIATAANVPCQVTEANLLGVTAAQEKSYEAACVTGPGYILIASTPPQAVDCVLLAGQLEIERLRDPNVAPGTQCAIPQNTDVLRVIGAYATEAGVPCAPDQAGSIGKSSAGNLVYEVGCNGVDGYWIEKLATGWKTTECLEVVSLNGTCRFSTKAEQLATLKGRLAANAEAAACDPTDARYMGANANGSFYEAKCGGGNGIIVRFDPQFAVQQVYPCETAQRIGGGCTLTVVPAAPEAAPAQQ